MDKTDKIFLGITSSVLGICAVVIIAMLILLATGKVKDDPDIETDCIYVYQPSGVIIPICTSHKKSKK